MVAFLAGEFLTIINRVVMRWTRLVPVGHADVLAARHQGRPLIFVGWHGHNFVNLGAYLRLFGQDCRAVIMVRDDLGGRILAHLARRSKITVVFLGTDPSSFKWAKGVAKVIHLVESGHDALLAVDGPEGPACQVRPGAVLMARRAGAMLVPMVAASNRRMDLVGRWDKHMIPLPGARTVVHFGPLIDPLAQRSLPPQPDELREEIGEALIAGMRQAELCLDSASFSIAEAAARGH